MKRIAAFGLAFALAAPVAQAATLGPVSFTTAPARVLVVNEFGPFIGQISNLLTPTGSYTVSVSSTIASAQGLPDLVGQSLSFNYYVNNGFNILGSYSLQIGGVETLIDPLFMFDDFLMSPPIASVDLGAPGENDTYSYSDPFSDFGPRTQEFPEFLVSFDIDQALPTRLGYEQCNANNQCEFSFDTPLTEIAGLPVVDSYEHSFTEGAIDAGTITFSTTAPVSAAVPLPAAGFLLLAGLAGLGLARRKA